MLPTPEYCYSGLIGGRQAALYGLAAACLGAAAPALALVLLPGPTRRPAARRAAGGGRRGRGLLIWARARGRTARRHARVRGREASHLRGAAARRAGWSG